MELDGHVPVLRIDGAAPLTATTVAAVRALCDHAEERAGDGAVVLHVLGTPTGEWADDLTVALVNKWERQLRRLECLPVTTVAVASGDCGGPALDALLATDYRIAAGPVRLVVPTACGATWPGMAVYRLTQQAAGSTAVRSAVLFGQPLDTTTARSAHLIDELVDDVAAAVAIAAELAGRTSGSELAVRRRLMFEAATTSFEEALGVHLAACDRMLRQVAGAVS